MTNKEFKDNMIKVIGQDTSVPSLTNPKYTKKQVWDRLWRQCTTAPNEEGYPADREYVVDAIRKELETRKQKTRI